MKLFNKLFLVMVTLCVLNTNVIARTYDAQLVLDMRNTPTLPKHFRMTSNPLPQTINTTGLSALHIAGGAQFSKLALDSILERLGTKNVTIIDLREESHGFLNGNAISWYASQDAANAGMSDGQIERTQARLLNELNHELVAKVAVILDKSPDSEITKTKTIEFSVRNVFSEEELANDMHLNYRRLYVQDYHAPTPKQVDRFVQIVKQLPANKWMYFHCRAGIGRTTTFMVMYDMMRNAKNVSFDDIIARQVALGGKDLTDLPDKDSFKYQPADKRLDFLHAFYQYAHDNHDNFDTTFSRFSRKYKLSTTD